MALESGTKLGVYEVLSRIGAGGMGEVYRARDTRLDRDVAIKALPDAMARDADRIARFEHEARTLASINHPNIAAIYGVEVQGGQRYLILEYVEGQTLAERLQRGPMAIDEALEVCSQIAAGVEAAHEAAIIHRDLKPANVKIAPDGKVKVLDFGLAKSADGVTSNSSQDVTITSPVRHSPTVPGVILGTAAYMSPEQARGRSIDRRTDVWSFGVVLFECLTGSNPFIGETVSDCIGAILHKDVNLDRLPADTPRLVRHVIGRCLQRDKAQRLRDLGDARIELQTALAGADPFNVGAAADPQALAHRTPFGFLPWFVAAAALLALLVVWIGGSGSVGPKQTQPAFRFSEALPSPRTVAISDAPAVAVSPDGRTIAYVGEDSGGTQIYLRALDGFESKPLHGTENAALPFFSRDGKWLGFAADRAIKKVAIDGGAPFVLSSIGDNSRGGSWAPDGSLVFTVSATQPLVRLSAASSELAPVTSLDLSKNERTHRWVQVLPSGQAAIYSVGTRDSPENYENARIEAVRFSDGARKTLFEGASMARYGRGYLLCARKGALLAMSFDAEKLEVTGAPFPVLSGVMMTRNSGAAHFDFSEGGTLVYVPGGEATSEATLIVADRTGNTQELPFAPAAYVGQSLSPDGSQLALIIEGPQANDIWVANVTDGGMNRLTFEGQNLASSWRPGGKEIAFGSARARGLVGIYLKQADGSGQEQLIHSANTQLFPCSWTSDGKVLIFEQMEDSGDPDIWIIDVSSTGEARPYMDGSFRDRNAQLSPNGRWLAYQSDETGRHEVYVQAFPGPGGKWQISRDGGREPRWASSGLELFYPNENAMMAVSVDDRDGFRYGQPTALFEGYFPPITGAGLYGSYSVSPDGQKFYMIKPSRAQTRPSQINVVVNWSPELER